MKELIANVPILFEGRQYKVGERLPTANREMVEAWLGADTASWRTFSPIFEMRENVPDSMSGSGETAPDGMENEGDETPEDAPENVPEEGIPVVVKAVQECADAGIPGAANGSPVQENLVGTVPPRPQGRNKKR